MQRLCATTDLWQFRFAGLWWLSCRRAAPFTPGRVGSSSLTLPFPGNSDGFCLVTGSNSDEIPSAIHPYIPDKYEKSVTRSSTRARTISPQVRSQTGYLRHTAYRYPSLALAAPCSNAKDVRHSVLMFHEMRTFSTSKSSRVGGVIKCNRIDTRWKAKE